jgi:hypothetical protein
MEMAARLFEERDRLAHDMRMVDDAIRAACLEFSNQSKMWCVSPVILRRELRMRGLA